MRSPKAWIEDGATPLESELLDAGKQLRLPNALRNQLWTQIASQCIPPALPPNAPGTASPATLGWAAAHWPSLLLKGGILLAAVGGISLAVRWVPRAGLAVSGSTGETLVPSARSATATSAGTPHQPVPVGIDSAVPVDALSKPISDRGATPMAGVSRHLTKLPSSVTSADGARTHSALGEESLALIDARSALRSGDAEGALRRLTQMQARFPKGALLQEREALAIESLAQLAAYPQAKERARAFLRAYPRSPHAATLRGIAER